MSEYYNATRTRNLYDPNPQKPFRLSRGKIDLFLECQRCFYLDRRLGVGRPPGFPFNLNSAVDALLKKEFDTHRAAGTVHPLTKAYGLNLVPFEHEHMERWRDSLRRGITYEVPETNIILTGGIDDVWIDPKSDQIVIVDYKATSKDGEVSLDASWQISYKRQMEVYQWLFRRNGFDVSSIGYFVYCNGKTDRAAFDGKLEFDIKLIPYSGDDNWVESGVRDAHKTLCADTIPNPSSKCDYCNYNLARTKVENPSIYNSKQDQQRLI